MAQYAQNFTEFTEKSISALCTALNDTETGKRPVCREWPPGTDDGRPNRRKQHKKQMV